MFYVEGQFSWRGYRVLPQLAKELIDKKALSGKPEFKTQESSD